MKCSKCSGTYFRRIYEMSTSCYTCGSVYFDGAEDTMEYDHRASKIRRPLARKTERSAESNEIRAIVVTNYDKIVELRKVGHGWNSIIEKLSFTFSRNSIERHFILHSREIGAAAPVRSRKTYSLGDTIGTFTVVADNVVVSGRNNYLVKCHCGVMKTFRPLTLSTGSAKCSCRA